MKYQPQCNTPQIFEWCRNTNPNFLFWHLECSPSFFSEKMFLALEQNRCPIESLLAGVVEFERILMSIYWNKSDQINKYNYIPYKLLQSKYNIFFSKFPNLASWFIRFFMTSWKTFSLVEESSSSKSKILVSPFWNGLFCGI